MTTCWHFWLLCRCQHLLGGSDEEDAKDTIRENIDQLMTPSMQKVTAVHAR